jgi:D-alanine-D-alanine ligase
MTIGFTYDLKEDYLKEGWTEEDAAEFDSSETIEGIDEALTSLGYKVDRIGNARNLMKRISSGERWDFVFNICESRNGFAREALVPSILEEYRIPYSFSDPLILSLSLHKGLTKKIIRSYGILTPDYRIIKGKKDLFNIRLPFPLFVKPVAEGTGKGISPRSKVENMEDLKMICLELIEKFEQPVLVEKFLPGREFTVGLVGTQEKAKVVGVMEVLFKEKARSKIYTYQNKAEYEDRIKYTMVGGSLGDVCSDLALRSWKALGCKDGGRVDIRLDVNGSPNFLEVNPLAGLNPKHSDLPILSNLCGWTYSRLIEEILDSALARYELKKS